MYIYRGNRVLYYYTKGKPHRWCNRSDDHRLEWRSVSVTDRGVEAPVRSNKRLRLVFAVFPRAFRSKNKD